MGKVNQTSADRNYKILAFLSSGQWEILGNIHTYTGINETRLKETLSVWKKRDIIKSWEDLTEPEKKEVERSQTKEMRGKNYYQITYKGRQKFEKIRDSCLDSDIRVILGMRHAKDEND